MSKHRLLTQAESDFVHHYCREAVMAVQATGDREPGPATRWLRAHDIFPTTMQPFQYAEQCANEDYINWITDAPLPSFQPAWSSREEFEARAAEIVEAYPVLKTLPSALPGYHPEHYEVAR
jgi:hypothetical protein